MEKTYSVSHDPATGNLVITEPMQTVITLPQLERSRDIMKIQLERLEEKIKACKEAIGVSDTPQE